MLKYRAAEVGTVGPNFTTGLTLAQVTNGNSSAENKTVLAVEIPLILVAICTVVLRVYSRLGIKRKLAVDDVLIICGTICAVGRTIISCMNADDVWGFDRDGPDQVSELPYYRVSSLSPTA